MCHLLQKIIEIDTEESHMHTFSTRRNSTVAAVICGLVAVTVLMIIVTCFYCKCCLLYKKRRSQLQLPGGNKAKSRNKGHKVVNKINSGRFGGKKLSKKLYILFIVFLYLYLLFSLVKSTNLSHNPVYG